MTHIEGLPRTPKKIPPSFEPTTIVRMECKACGTVYTRKSGLMIDGKLSRAEGKLVVNPCTGIPATKMLNGLDLNYELTQEQMDAIEARINERKVCGGTDYIITRDMQPVAMPIGRHFTDLSRKHN